MRSTSSCMSPWPTTRRELISNKLKHNLQFGFEKLVAKLQGPQPLPELIIIHDANLKSILKTSSGRSSYRSSFSDSECEESTSSSSTSSMASSSATPSELEYNGTRRKTVSFSDDVTDDVIECAGAKLSTASCQLAVTSSLKKVTFANDVTSHSPRCSSSDPAEDQEQQQQQPQEEVTDCNINANISTMKHLVDSSDAASSSDFVAASNCDNNNNNKEEEQRNCENDEHY